mgnify:CR=1 FL=1
MKYKKRNHEEGCYKNPTKGKQNIIKSLIRTRVGNVHNQDVARADLNQLIHYVSNALLLHHRADSNPALLLERGDSRRALAGGNLRRNRQLVTRDVVLAQDELLCGDDTAQTGAEEGEHVAVGLAGLDQHGSAGDNGVNCLEASGLHSLTGL